jgi:D-alanyl-D-alanine carboxypeptidase/D-alanyl-D-alanine-endopeptidase (penicillin-binding protein 4)
MLRLKIFLFLIIPSLCAAQLNTVLEEWKNDKALKNASIAFSVLDAKTSEVIAEHDSHRALIPASTLKIVSTSAAINLLGIDFRYETKLLYTGEFNKKTGVLNGDLIIMGSGDPTLGSENFYKDEKITDKWAIVLKDKGLKEIKGKIIGDASYFDRGIPNAWIWEDISNYYGATSCGLSFMDNKFKVNFSTKESGSLAKITGISPSYLSNSITLTSDVTAKGTEDEAYAYGDPFSFTKEIHGTIPPDKNNYEIEVALPDPALLCAEYLYTSLTQLGIKCNANLIRSDYKGVDNGRQLVYTHYSPTLDRIIYFTNIKSINHYCESITRTIGKGNKDAGLNQVKKYWSARGIDTTELFMDDACGLSRINTATTNFESQLLCKIYRDTSMYKILNGSLPIAGKQGSMSSLGKGKFIENNLRAKTGYITRIRAYCGYVKTKSGKDLAFSVMFNNYNCSAKEARLKLEKFMVALGEL